MKWFALLCVLFVGCQTDTATVPREVEARAEQLSQILVQSKGVAVKQDAAIEILNVQTESLTTVAESLQDVASKVDALTELIESTKPVSTVMTSESAVAEPEKSEEESGDELPPHYSDEVSIENWSASYCGVCRTEKNILEALKNTTGLQYWTYMSDDPKRREFVKTKQIERVPTLRFIRRGKEMARLVGLRQAIEIQDVINKVRAMDLTDDESVVSSDDDLTIRLKLPAVNTRWGIVDLEEFNGDCTCPRCVDLRALKASYLAKPEYQNVGRKVETSNAVGND